jgi:F0F1-type ATP synthase beta subunit
MDKLEEEVVKESKKISKFINQFLIMSECFRKQNRNDGLKNRLKIAWKWIKDVVKEWSQLKHER